MIWEPDAIDYSAGFTRTKEGILKPNKIGTWVETCEELNVYLRKRGIIR